MFHFHYFNLLVYEIRIQIWTELIEPRIVPIKRDGQHDLNDGTQGWKIFAPQPVLFFICSESRELALKKYRLLFNASCRINTNLYLNPDIDLLFLSSTDPSSQDLAKLELIHYSNGCDYEAELYHYNWWQENSLWEFYWDKPGMMRLAVDILCKYGGITDLALDFLNFPPASRDILRLNLVNDGTGLFLIQDESFDNWIDEQIDIAILLSEFPLETITYIHKGDEAVVQGQTIQRSELREHLGPVELMSTGTLFSNPCSNDKDYLGVPWLACLDEVQASKVNMYLRICQREHIARNRGRGGGQEGGDGGGEQGVLMAVRRRKVPDCDTIPALLFRGYSAT